MNIELSLMQIVIIWLVGFSYGLIVMLYIFLRMKGE